MDLDQEEDIDEHKNQTLISTTRNFGELTAPQLNEGIRRLRVSKIKSSPGVIHGHVGINFTQ